jgi:hypothetical protein
MREKSFNLHARRRDPLTAPDQDLDTANECGLGAAHPGPVSAAPVRHCRIALSNYLRAPVICAQIAVERKLASIIRRRPVLERPELRRTRGHRLISLEEFLTRQDAWVRQRAR